MQSTDVLGFGAYALGRIFESGGDLCIDSAKGEEQYCTLGKDVFHRKSSKIIHRTVLS